MLAVRTAILHYPVWHEALSQSLHQVVRAWPMQMLVLDEIPCGGHRHVVEERMRQFCDQEEADWLITLGGTWPAPGPSGEEIVPLATAQILERTLPGLAEAMRGQVAEDYPQALLDASITGIRGVTYVLNLPADEQLLPRYLTALRPAIPALLHTLRGEADPLLHPPKDPAGEEPIHGLQASEFAAFRAARGPSAHPQAPQGGGR